MSLERLRFLLANNYFIIKTDDVDQVGQASYNKETKILMEEGMISITDPSTIEYLVYKAEDTPPENGGEFQLSVSTSNTILEYSEPDAQTPRPTPKAILKNALTIEKVVLPKISGANQMKLQLSNALSSAVPFAGAIGMATSVVSPVLLYNALGYMAKYFQIIEVLSNIALANADLGILIQSVLGILDALKFPLKLTPDFFWPDYEQASEIYFWKHRHQLTVHERELFILCNEMLMILLYLSSWVIWLFLLCLKSCLSSRKEKSSRNEINKNGKDLVDSFNQLDSESKNKNSEVLNTSFDDLKAQDNDEEEVFRRDNTQLKYEGINLTNLNKNRKHNSNRQDSNSKKMKENSLQKDNPPKNKTQNNNETKNKKKKEKPTKLDEKENLKSVKEKKKGKLAKMISYMQVTKDTLFLMIYFDAQFITNNELLHSDVLLFKDPFSRPAISYTLSVLVLCLMTMDLWWIMGSSFNLSSKIRNNQELTEKDKEYSELFFEDVKTEAGVSPMAMNFNLISMLRFSLYQTIIVSMQLSPNFQTRLLFLLQLIFYVFYLNESRKQGVFESGTTTAKFVIFEGCTLVFTLLCFIFSFENSHSWFSSKVLAWLQILAAVIILISVLIKFLTLVVNIIENVIALIKEKCCGKKKKIEPKDSKEDGKDEEKQNKEELSIRDKNISTGFTIKRMGRRSDKDVQKKLQRDNLGNNLQVEHRLKNKKSEEDSKIKTNSKGNKKEGIVKRSKLAKFFKDIRGAELPEGSHNTNLLKKSKKNIGFRKKIGDLLKKKQPQKGKEKSGYKRRAEEKKEKKKNRSNKQISFSKEGNYL